MEKTMLFDSLFCSNTGLKKRNVFQNFLFFLFFMKSPIEDILLFPLKGYWLFCFMGPGQGEVTAKQKGKEKEGETHHFVDTLLIMVIL